ncbi:dipeptidase [Carboxylicivirga caseinilyticus]|uniref:dipeptidase n=1 Tax=Carboxylicivirga caseinilyticus TaxID=3417572 RepID=UPI003D34C39F|nr:C69 family dipeptidase [Marinilabiliaceae bacterium A049]
MKQQCLFVLIGLISLSSIVNAQSIYDQKNEPYFGESCTSIMVSKGASSDGSVITSHTCDGRYRTWITMEEGETFENDTTTPIFKGKLRTETPWDMRNVKQVGLIPQAKQTFAFLNTAYPCLNEKQLAIGETTIVGPEELVNENGMFLIEELERIALQRCSTARDAIQLIGQLIKEYGYGDWGECITIADKKEVWQLEIFGEGPDKIGGVWAAQRIPEGHVGVSANISRIGELKLKDKDHFMASENVFSVAKSLGRWDGKKPFKFWKAYGDNEKPFNIREFFILSKLAPSLNLSYDAAELPFSVQPDKPVSVQDVMALYRQTYEGTEYDMTQNIQTIKKKRDKEGKVISQDTVKSPIANPWLTGAARNTYNYLDSTAITFQRTVAVSWCSYSEIIQLRDWLPDEVGGVAWLSFDNPGQSPRIPIYAGTTKLPPGFEYCGQKRYREDAIIWKYRKANKLATLAWQETKEAILNEVTYFEEKGINDGALLEKKVNKLLEEEKKEDIPELLNRYTTDFTGATIYKWNDLENYYWGRFGMGF